MKIQDGLVEMDQLIQPAFLRAHRDVVDLLQADRSGWLMVDILKLRQEVTVEIATLDKTVNGIAKGSDRRFDYLAPCILSDHRLHYRPRSSLHCLLESAGGVTYREGNVFDTVAMNIDVLRRRTVDSQPCGQHQPNIVLLHHKRHMLALAGFEANEANRSEAKDCAIEVGRLLHITYVEFNVVKSVKANCRLFVVSLL